MATEWQQNAGFVEQSGAERRQPRSPWGHRQLSSDDVRREMTGRRTDPKVHLARIAAGELLAEQQQAMIAKMLEAGVDLRRPSDNVLVDLITGETKPLQGSRMCRFLPNVAKRERGEYLNSLEAFMSSDEMKFARYGVITAGQPIVAMDASLRYVLQSFHRKLSRWASIASARFGIDVIARCTESTREKLSDRGLVGDEFSYHVHANVVYRPRSYSPLVFATFLSWTRRFFGTHWSDAGLVKNVREIVKYMVKPTDLAEAPGSELVWLFEATQKLKFMQALGPFAAYRRALEKAGLKTKSISSQSGERETVFVKKDTRKPSMKAEMRAQLEMEAHELIGRLEREENDEAATEWLDRLGSCLADLDALNLRLPNMIVGVLPPACRFVHYATPAVLISGFTTLSDLSSDPKFRILRDQAMTHWMDNRAPSLLEARAELDAARAEIDALTAEKLKNNKKPMRALKTNRRKSSASKRRSAKPKRYVVSRPAKTLRA